jgi:hypothetical protein
MPAAQPAPPPAVHWLDPDSAPQLRAYLYAPDSALTDVPLCSSTEAAIDGDSIGPLRVGQRLASVIAVCPRYLVGWDWGDEAIPEPALAVRFGRVLVLVTLTDTTQDGTVYYLATTSHSARTRDGVHINMSIDSAASLLGRVEFFEEECSLYAHFPSRPHLCMQLTLPADSLDCGMLVPTPPALPRGSRVAKLFLHGGA